MKKRSVNRLADHDPSPVIRKSKGFHVFWNDKLNPITMWRDSAKDKYPIKRYPI